MEITHRLNMIDFTQEELASYKHKASVLFSIFGEKSLEVTNQVISTLEELLRWEDSEFIAISLGYWYNIEAEIKTAIENKCGFYTAGLDTSGRCIYCNKQSWEH